jgi:hypothetical protein
MKKTILALSLMMSLVACSGSGETEETTVTDSTQVVSDTTVTDSTKVDTVEVK